MFYDNRSVSPQTRQILKEILIGKKYIFLDGKVEDVVSIQTFVKSAKTYCDSLEKRRKLKKRRKNGSKVQRNKNVNH